MADCSRSGCEQARVHAAGFALIAVLVALSILLMLGVPFAISMGHGEAVAIDLAEAKHAELASASWRDALLQRVAQTHDSVDLDPRLDTAAEFPASLTLPAELAAAMAPGNGTRQLVSAEAEDLQRRICLDSASPLVLGNLLGLCTRLTEDHPADADQLRVEDASRFPDQGWLVVDRELIRYAGIDGNELVGLERGMLAETHDFEDDVGHGLVRGELVIDFRVVVAITQSFYHDPEGSRSQLRSLPSVDALAGLGRLGFGAFSTAELDVLRACTTVGAVHRRAARWGAPERLFAPVGGVDDDGRGLRVRSIADIGGGCVVRLRTLDGQHTEYGLVWSVREVGRGAVAMPRAFELQLLRPVAQPFPANDTVVEVLLPHPVNVNTASRQVLAAIVQNLRYGTREAHASGPPRWFTAAEAWAVAGQILALRGEAALDGLLDGGPLAAARRGPFTGFQDLAQRYFEPVIAAAESDDRARWLRLYSALMIGRSGHFEMATAPLAFTSAPVVRYRAAALRARGTRVTARHERQGIAVVMPGATLDLLLATQADFERQVRLDRQMPYYTTFPINLGSYVPFDPTANPPSRAIAHLLPVVAPDVGFGAPRFPSRADGGGVQSATAAVHPAYGGDIPFAYESMWAARHPEGWDVAREGPYAMFNSGTRSAGGGAPPPPAAAAHRPTFPFTIDPGFVRRHAIGFWLRLDDTGDQMLLDLSAGDPLRNRISLQIRERELVLEVIDEAGIDPDPGVGTAPARSAGTWRVPLARIDLQEGVWYHASLGVEGNRPGQLQLLIDGVPRGEPELQTYLTAAIGKYTPPGFVALPGTDPAKHLDIEVESTAGFPPRGVLRIGLELFEYTSRTPTSFQCALEDSMGGRIARMALAEYSPGIPVDEHGIPTISLGEVVATAGTAVAPSHDAGAAVQLYGYSVPLYPDTVMSVGAGRLLSPVGPFAVARLITTRDSINAGPVPLGQGISETFSGNLELGEPPTAANLSSLQPASAAIMSAFQQSGGYALLVQYFVYDWIGGSGTKKQGAVAVGGIELIRYGGRSGNQLTGIVRGLSLPTPIASLLSIGGAPLYDGSARKFVSEWSRSVGARGVEYRTLPQRQTYVVPISLGVQGSFTDPSVLGRTEWVQLWREDGGAASAADTEWVRYDYLDAGNLLVRARSDAWREVWEELTLPGAVLASGREGTTTENPSALATSPYAAVAPNGNGFIGYIEQIEIDYPQIQAARRALGFRGDPATRTTSHAHGTSSRVLPLHRVQLVWGNYGAVWGRIGRNDRVCLVAGSQASGTRRPPIEWQTVTWAASFYGPSRAAAAQGPELLGPDPFQLVGFEGPVTDLFIGPAQLDPTVDVRTLDRLVKFPSGELPAAAPEQATFGATVQGDAPAMRGLIDELQVVARRAEPLQVEVPFDETATEFAVRPDLRLTPFGAIAMPGADLTALFPPQGGLVWIDGEIMAYRSRQDGRFEIAENGRGLLGTEPRAHDEGARVHFLDQVPAAILASGLDQGDEHLVVEDIGSLPRYGGTLLVGRTELLHYCWTVGRQLLEMPSWTDPDDPSADAEHGLLRGRYGTTPVSAQAGEPVIAMPFRYWDRAHARADDPELAHYQVTWNLAPVWFRTLTWREEQVDPLVDLRCLVRIDGKVPWSADPATTPGLFLLTDPAPNDIPNRLHYQGSLLEARWQTVYLPGAFDPQTFQAQAWKKAPRLRMVYLDYEGQSRVITEEITVP